MEAIHTPGPWALRQHGPHHFTVTGQAPGLIADIHTDRDAALVRAAPDLLAALMEMCDSFGHYCEGDPSEDEIKALETARAAISKATEI